MTMVHPTGLFVYKLSCRTWGYLLQKYPSLCPVILLGHLDSNICLWVQMRPGESVGLATEMQGCSGRTGRDMDEDEAVHTDKRESTSVKEGVMGQ